MRAASNCWRAAKPTLLKHYLPLGLGMALFLGLTVPAAGAAVAKPKVAGRGAVSFVCVMLIFIISGLTLKTDDVKKALQAWKATLFGFVSILFITPLLALLPQQLPFLPPEFQIGLLIFCSMPTTVNSGVALAQTAKGNFALALLLTVCTNLLGVLTVPFYLSALLGVGGFKLDPVPLLVNLLMMILLPLAVGKAVRELSPRAQAFVKAHKKLVGNFANTCLIMIPWMKISVSQPKIVGLSASALLGLVACGLIIHLVYLGFNYASASALRLPLEMKKAIVIMCSQKTLPTAMTVVSLLPEEMGDLGLVALPPIVSHLVQLFIDAAIASKWAQYTDDGAAGRGGVQLVAPGGMRSEDTAHAAPAAASMTVDEVAAAVPVKIVTGKSHEADPRLQRTWSDPFRV